MAYIHIGGEYSIPRRLIVGIFDLDNTSVARSRGTNDFLAESEAQGIIEYVSEDLPRTFVVTLERVYVTPISVATLRARLRSEERIDEI